MSWVKNFRNKASELLSEVKHQGLMKWVLSLNLLDILTTLFVIEWFGGTELNPIMAFLLSSHPVVFVTVKILVLQLVVGLSILSEVKGGKVPAFKFDGFIPKLYFKTGHFTPKWIWLLIIGIFSLTLMFNLSMIIAGFVLL